MTTTNTEGLKPDLLDCPFCGKQPVSFVTGRVYCQTKDCPGGHGMANIETWNRRPIAQASEAIPDAFDNRPRPDSFSQGYVDGWNGYRDALLKIRALSTMPVEPVTNPHDAIRPVVQDAPSAINGTTKDK